MKITADDLKKEEELITEDIDEFCKDMISDEAGPIYDGVVNIEKYLNGEKYRICWVLKEAYDEGDKKGGSWYLCEFIGCEKRWREVANHPTWKKVIYATYGIINDFIEYSNMDYITDDPEMVKCLNHIAVINVNKMPGDSTSDNAVIASEYKRFKLLLHRQLEKYDPQIIIFGGTFQHFQNDLEIKDEEISNYKDNKKPRYIVKNGKLYVDAYHPAVRPSTMIEDYYIQSIIDIVKMNRENIE